jgi:hypothetical protein
MKFLYALASLLVLWLGKHFQVPTDQLQVARHFADRSLHSLHHFSFSVCSTSGTSQEYGAAFHVAAPEREHATSGLG